ncbi:MAG: histidine kinase dimerization/phosphoacceptor domain -containing protein [Bacteroidota bacterium]|nr:histidine kinase dimerization/phosphoacceptor domain -containing protein [Bacteroidota bacterium]
MLKKFWRFISGIGVQDHYDEKQIKRINLTNQFNLLVLLTVVFNGIHNILLNDVYSGLALEGLGILCMVGYWINHKHFHKFATSFLMFTILTSLFYFDSYAGLGSGTYLFYFLVVLGVPFVFDYKTERLMMLIHGGIALSYLSINLLTHHKLFANPLISEEDRYQMFIFNIFFSAVTVGFFIYLNVSNNLRENYLYEQHINERMASEKTIHQALEEKELLLAELHHRVKNNMAIISGLFTFTIDTTQSEEAKIVLLESKNRIQSMSLIHNKLFKSKDLSKINFSEYLNELLKEIQASYPSTSNTVIVQKNISDIELNVSKAIPCGLILNELLTNCYKHAFKGKEAGNIDILFSREATKLKLTVKDNGVGLKPDYDKSESIGLTVVHALSDQLEGTYSYVSHEGTHFELSFEHAN